MKTLVRFRTGSGTFAVPVEATTAVRAAAGLVTLPGCRDDVVGLLPGEPPITVLSTLGCGRDHILVIAVDDVVFGLLVEEVLGVQAVEEATIGARPEGQDEEYITGTISGPDGLTLIVDPVVLAGRL
ncbi:MAG: chemotaxis protein CheW [Ilumatobacteraceae bacterium]